jgi:phage shock protein A
MSGALAKFGAKSSTDDARFAAVAEGFEQMGDAFAAHVAETTTKLSASDKTIGELQTKVADLQAKYSALDTTPAGTTRPAATGGNGAAKTDC